MIDKELLTEGQKKLQIGYLKNRLDNGFILLVNEEEYKSLPEEIKGHPSVIVNKPLPAK